MQITRYAIYWLPPQDSPLARFGAQWLGWDLTDGPQPAPALPLPAHDLSASARKYGFHATLKAPFRLAPNTTAEALTERLRQICAGITRFDLPGGFRLTDLAGFLALTPRQDSIALNKLQQRLAEDLDPFRAPLTEADLARRTPDRLTSRQRELLMQWGYPFTHDQFRFHLTLTGPVPQPQRDQTRAILVPHLAPLLPDPQPITEIALVAEGSDGLFRHLLRVPLGAG